MSIFADFKEQLKRSDIVVQSIYLLLAAYVMSLLFPRSALEYWALSSVPEDWMHMPWTLFTHILVHTGLFHILANILILFYIGSLFLDFMSKRQYILYFLAGTFTGAVFFLGFYHLNGARGILTGASAAVTSVMVGIAVKIPHYSLRLRFIGSVELWVLTLFWIAISVLATGGIHAGGAMAHLGGAVAGFVISVFFKEGKAFAGKKKPENSPYVSPYAKLYRREKKTVKPSELDKRKTERKLNEILDKINRSGYDSLTRKEKEFLMSQQDD